MGSDYASMHLSSQLGTESGQCIIAVQQPEVRTSRRQSSTVSAEPYIEQYPPAVYLWQL